MRRVEWAEAAVADLRNLSDEESFYREAADEITERLVLATDWLLDWPNAGRAIGDGDWRKWSPRRTGHVLIYRPTADGIEISRVRQERENWLSDL